MVTYPDLSNLNNQSWIAGLMSLPNSSYPYYWWWILGGIWCIMVFTMYFKDKEKTGRGKILSSMSVASLAIVMLTGIGTLFGIISVDIIVYILVFSFLVWGVWFLTSKK